MSQEQEKKNRLLREEIQLKQKSKDLDRETVRESDEYSSLLREQLKGLQGISAEKSQILQIDRRLNKEIADAYAFDRKILTDRKALASINQKIAQQERDQVILRTKMGSLAGTDLERNKAINSVLGKRIRQSEQLVEGLEEQAKLAEKIAGDLGVRTFRGAAGIAEAFGFRDLAPELDKAATAASEQALTNMGNKEAREALLDKQEKSKLLEGLDIDINTGRGITQKIAKDLGLEGGVFGSKAGKQLRAKGLGNPKDIAKQLSGLAKSQSTFLAGLKALGPLLRKVLGPLAIILDIMSIDKATGELAQGLNMSYQEALRLKMELTDVGLQSGNAFVNSKQLAETLLSVNKALGTSVPLSGELAVQLTEMREMAGFTNEELQGIAAISLATGKSANEITGEFMAQAKITAMQNGVLLNEKELLKDIGKVSAATTLSFAKNPKLIAEAVSMAKSLGMELSQVEGIADSLLNFEQSISDELEAELLLNKDINLERARQAALNNNLAVVAEEIAAQFGTAAEFSEMNRIQQESIAKAVNMNREDLAKTLFVQEQLRGLTGDQAQETQDLLNARIKEVGLAQAQKELAQDGVEGLRQQVSMAQRFTAVMNKLQELFVNLFEPLLVILDPLVSFISGVAKLIAMLEPFMGTITGALTGFVVSGFNPVGALVGGLLGAGSDLAGAGLTSSPMMGSTPKLNPGQFMSSPTSTTTTSEGKLKTDNSDMIAELRNMNALMQKQQMSPVGLYQVSRNATV